MMEKQITELLIPFVTAVREEVNKLMPKLTKLQYHYGYSLTIGSIGKWFNDYEISNFDPIARICNPRWIK